MRRSAVVLCAALGALTACSRGTGPQGPLAGHWYGTSTDYGLDLVLSENGTAVSGSGTLGGPALASNVISITVSGLQLGDSFNLTLRSAAYQPAAYAGTIANDTTLAGAISGSGFMGDTVLEYRQH